MLTKTFTSLALLKARFESESKDVIDAFIGFAEKSIFLRQAKNFTAENMKDWFELDYGLQIPLHSIHLILNRMRKRKEELGTVLDFMTLAINETVQIPMPGLFYYN
jgi:hypothetical protein